MPYVQRSMIVGLILLTTGSAWAGGSKGVGVRKMNVDAEGRLWYMGSHNGRLGALE